MSQHESSIEIGALSNKTKLIPLILGPLLALAFYFILPETYTTPAGETAQFSHAGRACASVVLWMGIWWFTEAVPIAVTALLPIVIFPLFGITTPAEALKNYANSTIYLFMGGFLIAAGIARWGLDRRIALLTIRIVGTRPQQIILGVMLATAFLSAWVSNTATAAMMLPIAIAIMGVVRRKSKLDAPDVREHNFNVCLLLSIAYGASLGGMITLIGTPPNGIFVRFVEQTYNEQVSFLEWLKISLPVGIGLLAATYIIMTKFLFRRQIDAIEGGRQWVSAELASLGKLSRGEKIVLTVFVCAALLWVFGPFLRALEIGGMKPLKPMSDAVIAMGAGIILFIIPVDYKKGIHALDWSSASEAISWDVLLLFGGGLSMAAAIQSTGAAQVVGSAAMGLSGLPDWGITTGVTAIAVMASEFTSNTALAATMMPLVAAISESLKINPETLLLCTTFGASCAFMMPVGTPPNAMVFGTGKIRIGEMIRAGIWLNIVAIILIPLLCILIAPGILSSLQAPL